MEQSITIKTKLVTDQAMPEFEYLSKQFRDACNFVSKWIFNHNFELNQAVINRAIYYDIRQQFNLKAQLAQSAIRSTVARYRTVKTQLKARDYHIYDKSVNKNYYIERDLNWLQKPIKFNKPQADLQRNRDWSFVNGQLSINTLSKLNG